MANKGRTAAGALLKYCVEGTAGTMPTTGYTTLPEVKVIPELGNEVETAQTTPLSATKNHTYCQLLDTLGGGAFSLTANDCLDFRTSWNAMMDAYATAKAAGKGMWIEIYIPNNVYKKVGDTSAEQNSYFLPVEPLPLGIGEMTVDAVMEISGNFLPQGDWVEDGSSN